MDMNKYGFSPEEWREMLGIFARHPEIERVTLFGSRARNTFKVASDVDIAVYGSQVTHRTVSSLRGDMEESDLPYFFDVLDGGHIESDDLRANIRRDGKVIYEKAKEGWVETRLGEVVETNTKSI